MRGKCLSIFKKTSTQTKTHNEPVTFASDRDLVTPGRELPDFGTVHSLNEYKYSVKVSWIKTSGEALHLFFSGSIATIALVQATVLVRTQRQEPFTSGAMAGKKLKLGKSKPMTDNQMCSICFGSDIDFSSKQKSKRSETTNFD